MLNYDFNSLIQYYLNFKLKKQQPTTRFNAALNANSICYVAYSVYTEL